MLCATVTGSEHTFSLGCFFEAHFSISAVAPPVRTARLQCTIRASGSMMDLGASFSRNHQ